MKTVNGHTKSQRMTQIVWGLEWGNFFPLSLGDYELSASSFEEFTELKNSNNSFLITSEKSNESFVKDISSASKEEYLKSVSDFFTIKKDGEVIGVVVCEIRDWATYYLRYIFIAKEHRSHNLTSLFVAEIEKILRLFSVDKIVCDVSPSNLGQVARMSRAGYVYTGSILCERFGANMTLTKFLKDESWMVFNNNFIQMYYEKIETSRNEATFNV